MRRALILALVVAGCATPVVKPPRIDQGARIVYADTALVDQLCRDIVGWFDGKGRPVTVYHGCYDSRADLIILPHDAPRWLIDHEQLHRGGWSHDH